MASEEINAVINNLCEKLGTTASQLLPEIAKMKTAECMTTVIICFVVLCCGIFFTIKCCRACAQKDVF